MNPEQQLVEWFKELYASRTPPKSIIDAHPDYRVNWTETRAKMEELGFPGGAVDMRIVWAGIFVRNKLRAHCNKLIRATGSTVLMSAESSTSRSTRKKWGE